MKIRVFVATSLDGWIARENGALDWLPQEAPEGEEHGFAEFLEASDLLLMGRNTLDTVLGFGEWPYGSLATWVVSQTRTLEDLPSWVPSTVRIVSGKMTGILQEAQAQGYTSVYADGGQLVQSLLAIDRIDEMVVTRIPVLLGSGKPLFGALPKDLTWEHVQTRSWNSGLVQSQYVRNGIKSQI